MKSWFYFDYKYIVNEWKTLFRTKYLKDDINAGLSVACVAIPLSLAIALASSLTPGAGLTTAIIGGIVGALFGGTRLAVTGPAAAMSVLIAQCIYDYGLAGLIIIGSICGVLQIISGLLRLGRFTKMIPLPVISAFTAGIGFIIIIGQLPRALQLPAPEQSNAIAVIKHLGTYITDMNPMAFVLALVTLAIMKVLPRYFPRLPTPLIAVAIPTLIVYFFKLNNISLIGSIPHSLPAPSLPDFSTIQDWKTLIFSALEVFALASLETLLSSSAVDNLTYGEKHEPNQELIGQGLANISSACFGGLPVTGVIARSALNIAAGGKTRRSAIFHALVIILVVYLFPTPIENIPTAALAGILLSIAISMLNVYEVIEFWKADKFEVLIYLITFLVIVFTDLVEGVRIGLFAAFIIVAIRTIQSKTKLTMWKHKEILRINYSGSLVFWSYDKIISIQKYVNSNPHIKFIIIALQDLNSMDSTGATYLLNFCKNMHSNGVQIILHGASEQWLKILDSVNHDVNKSYLITVSESQIKEILHNAGITYSAKALLINKIEEFVHKYNSSKKSLITMLAKEQKPHTLIITCSDSRINPNVLFDAELGELFIVRNVGNIIPPYAQEHYSHSEGAAIEFAISNLGIRNIVILAHTDCGAVKALMQLEEKPPYSALNNWLHDNSEEFNIHKPQTHQQGVTINLLKQIDNLKTYPTIQKFIDQLTISAWIYDVGNTEVLAWDKDSLQFKPIKLYNFVRN